MVLLPAERIIVTVIAALAVLDGIPLWAKDVGIDVVGYAGMVTAASARWHSDNSIATSGATSPLPQRPRPPVSSSSSPSSDRSSTICCFRLHVSLSISALARFDAFFGFDWPRFVEWASQYPRIGMALRRPSVLSLPQLLVVIFVLGFSAGCGFCSIFF